METTALKERERKKKNPNTPGIRRKKMRRHKSKPDENHSKENKEEGRKKKGHNYAQSGSGE